MLLRSQVQQLIAKVFNIGSLGSSGGVSGGGLFGGLIIPGLVATGGPVSGRRPYIVGERGETAIFKLQEKGRFFSS